MVSMKFIGHKLVCFPFDILVDFHKPNNYGMKFSWISCLCGFQLVWTVVLDGLISIILLPDNMLLPYCISSFVLNVDALDLLTILTIIFH